MNEPELLNHLYGSGVVEPFVGDGAIVKALSPLGLDWYTNDLADYDFHRDSNLDLSLIENHQYLPTWPKSLISNPPYDLASEFLVMQSLIRLYPVSIMLLRQTWVNPGSGKKGHSDRVELLQGVKARITVPRYPMANSKKTGKPQCDSCNHEWIVWCPDNIWIHHPIKAYSSESIEGWESW